MLKYAIGIIALVAAIAVGVAQAPATPSGPPQTAAEAAKARAAAESKATEAHLKMLAARQKLESNPDFIEMMNQKQAEDSSNASAAILRQIENEKRKQEEAKKTATPK